MLLCVSPLFFRYVSYELIALFDALSAFWVVLRACYPWPSVVGMMGERAEKQRGSVFFFSFCLGGGGVGWSAEIENKWEGSAEVH